MLAPNTLSMTLASWRKAACVKQAVLAEWLGVSQAAVSNWETGRDAPSPRIAGRLADIMSPTAEDRYRLDRLAMTSQRAIRAAFDLDGVRLKMASRGLVQAWPAFSQLQDKRLIEHLVDEASFFLHDDSFTRLVRQGEVALISAVSDRHVQLNVDDRFRHRWTAVFRSYGPQVLVDMTYETCATNADTGIESVVYYDDLAA